MVRVMPKTFTEKGLYILAIILRSEEATQTTLGIIEAFSKMREFSSNMSVLPTCDDPEIQNQLFVKSTEWLAEVTGNDMKVRDTETTIELNLAIIKVKHTIKREQNNVREPDETNR